MRIRSTIPKRLGMSPVIHLWTGRRHTRIVLAIHGPIHRILITVALVRMMVILVVTLLPRLGRARRIPVSDLAAGILDPNPGLKIMHTRPIARLERRVPSRGQLPIRRGTPVRLEDPGIPRGESETTIVPPSPAAAAAAADTPADVAPGLTVVLPRRAKRGTPFKLLLTNRTNGLERIVLLVVQPPLFVDINPERLGRQLFLPIAMRVLLLLIPMSSTTQQALPPRSDGPVSISRPGTIGRTRPYTPAPPT